MQNRTINQMENSESITIFVNPNEKLKFWPRQILFRKLYNCCCVLALLAVNEFVAVKCLHSRRCLMDARRTEFGRSFGR